MQMHEFSTMKTARKRVGRGGKYRKTAGRGTKGQKARSGGNVDPLFEGGRSSLVQRMKKRRGFTAVRPGKCTVTLASLERAFSDGETVSLATLVARGVIRASQRDRGAKIVATGTLTKKLTVADDVDMTATVARQLAGGATAEENAAAAKKDGGAAKGATRAGAERGDDLTKIEGIGPKIAQTLVAAGVATFADLAQKTPDAIAAIISNVRGAHDPATWPRQAQLAAEGKWDELAAWQDELTGGKEA